MQPEVRATRFTRAFLGMQYLLGRRGSELQLPRGSDPLVASDAQALLGQLAHQEQELRARALAGEIAALVRALQERELK